MRQGLTAKYEKHANRTGERIMVMHSVFACFACFAVQNQEMIFVLTTPAPAVTFAR